MATSSRLVFARSGSGSAGAFPQPGSFEGLVARPFATRARSWTRRGAPDRDGARVVESATSGRNPREFGDADNIAPIGR